MKQIDYLIVSQTSKLFMSFLNVKPLLSFICPVWGAVFLYIVIVFIDICRLNYDWWSSCATGPKEALLFSFDSTGPNLRFHPRIWALDSRVLVPSKSNLCNLVSAHCEILVFIHRYFWLLCIKNTSHDSKIIFGMDTYSSVLVKLNGRET